MKHNKEVLVPAKKCTQVDYVTCDLCGQKIQHTLYEIDQVTVSHRTGNLYPDSGDETTVGVDMCGKCFDEKLVPWLRSNGAKLYKEENDW